MSGLLDGVRVIEVALLAPDALGMHLADLGADVIKVEPPGRGDYVRQIGGITVDGVSPLHRRWNRGKRSLALDLRTPDGVETFKELAAVADVVIEGLRAGSLARRGVGFDDLLAVNPKIVFAAMSGYGQTGPYRDLASHGVAYDAFAGLIPPVPGPGGFVAFGRPPSVGTAVGPLFGALAVCAAVIRARASGEGCMLDVAQVDAAVAWNTHDLELAGARAVGAKIEVTMTPTSEAPATEGAEDGREGLVRMADSVRYQYYPTKDDGYFLFMASERKFWENFARAVGREDLLERYPSAEVGDHARGNLALRAELTEIFQTRTRREWVELFLTANVPGIPVYLGTEMVDDPHFKARARMLDAEAHRMGGLGIPIQASVELPDPAPAPTVGQHTAEVLRSVLGYDDDRIAKLRATGALG